MVGSVLTDTQKLQELLTAAFKVTGVMVFSPRKFGVERWSLKCSSPTDADKFIIAIQKPEVRAQVCKGNLSNLIICRGPDLSVPVKRSNFANSQGVTF